ncbi:MAG: hypothetical protein EUB_02271 [Eubacterium sp.]|uniref:ImmA/IrrE family metallo-endopeptidase n=1 Tax=Eubacterium sp. TaxID=142586 RepID=UPI0030461DC7
MILSQKQIEEIAAAVTKDFNEFFFGAGFDINRSAPQATPIDQFAKDYLGLHIRFVRLSPDGSICGLTSYVDTEYIIEEKGIRRTIPLKENEVLLDESFIQSGQVRKLCGKRRFTLAHECAHQILFRMESAEIRESCKRKYSPRKAYSLRDLKSREDWNEWQANVLGAAILMPQKEIDRAMRKYAASRRLINYEGIFAYKDRLALSLLCQQLGVSKSAAIIRLRQLGYIEERPYMEYSDPLEVI